MLGISVICYLALTVDAAFEAFSEDPIPMDLGGFPPQEPYNLPSELQKRGELQKRDVGCYFHGTGGNYCTTGEQCCYNFSTGSNYAGYCCPAGGRCCGNGCCSSGYDCAWADQSTSQCCPNGSSCGDPTSTVTVTNTQTEVQTTVDYQTAVETAIATETRDNTVRETQTQVNTVTQQASTITQIQILTSVNSAGQTIVQTTAIQSIVSAAAAASNTAECLGGSKNNSNIGPIVGGAVGGVAFIALLAAFLFIGTRKGWFDKKQPTYPPAQLPVPIGGEPKNYGQQEAVPVSPVSQPVSHRNTMTPVPPYQPQPGYAQRPHYINEMEGTRHGHELPGNGHLYR